MMVAAIDEIISSWFLFRSSLLLIHISTIRHIMVRWICEERNRQRLSTRVHVGEHGWMTSGVCRKCVLLCRRWRKKRRRRRSVVPTVSRRKKQQKFLLAINSLLFFFVVVVVVFEWNDCTLYSNDHIIDTSLVNYLHSNSPHWKCIYIHSLHQISWVASSGKFIKFFL